MPLHSWSGPLDEPHDRHEDDGSHEADEEIAVFRDFLDEARHGRGVEELSGDLSREDSRNRAFLHCAGAMIRKSDLVLAILSADRWESQTGQAARDPQPARVRRRRVSDENNRSWSGRHQGLPVRRSSAARSSGTWCSQE